MKSKSIMRCMLLVLMMALIAFFWSSAALAQEICSGSAHISLSTSLNPIHIGQTESWGVFIGNDCFYGGNPANEVTAKFVANASLCGTSDVKVVMAFGESGTFTFQNCTNLNPHITSCALDPSDLSGNTVIIKTDCTGIDLTAGGPGAIAQLATINATATTLPPGNSTTAVGTSSLVPGFGPMITTDPICLFTEYAGAEGTITVNFLTQPCIDVNKSVNPTFTKPTDDVVYTIELCNCGDVELTNITVSDTKLGGDLVPPFPSTLAAGSWSDSTIIPNCVTKTFNHTIPSGTNADVPYVNVVTATGTPAGATQALAPVNAQASVDLFKPDATISKDCDCQESDPLIGCQAGDPVNYTITVRNLSTADTPAVTCTVKDALLGVNKTFTWNTHTGQVNTTTKTRTFQEDDPDCLTNTATLHCTIAGFPNEIDKDASCTVCKEKPPSIGGEEPFKAVVWDDRLIPGFYISPKVYQFTHPNTDYYATCTDVLFKGDPRIKVPPCKPLGSAFECPSACREQFKAKVSAVDQPEVCCTSKTVDDFSSDANNEVHCPDVKTKMTSKGNSGWYEWLIALPKKPVVEMNIEIECGVLKPNSLPLWGNESIELCAAVTGEQIGPNCTRIPGTALLESALPTLEVIAHPGCNSSSNWTPFHLTSYKNPGSYAIKRSGGKIVNNDALQVLNGSKLSRIALKACMEKTVLVKWPVEGVVNAEGETEHALEAGDLIKVRMAVPNANTVDVYCSQYSVTIGGIGIPETLLGDYNCDCISDANCQF